MLTDEQLTQMELDTQAKAEIFTDFQPFRDRLALIQGYRRMKAVILEAERALAVERDVDRALLILALEYRRQSNGAAA